MSGRAIGRSAAREGRTDWAALRRMGEADLRRAAVADPDAGMTPDAWWEHARIVLPASSGKESVTIRLDRDLLGWFRKQGRGYQTKINAVLRAFVEAQERR